MNNPQERVVFPQRLNAFLSLKWSDPHTKREERVFLFLKKKNGRRPKDERTQKNPFFVRKKENPSFLTEKKHPFKKRLFSLCLPLKDK
tara:strand:+ start:2628 stop:2891 length:264 start_codon:yes stop_codon:yes gene_type:complete